MLVDDSLRTNVLSRPMLSSNVHEIINFVDNPGILSEGQ